MQKSYIKHMVCAVLAVILLVWAGGCVTAEAAPAATPLSAFDWTIDAQNNTIRLTKYTGPGGAVVVAGTYTVDGAEYKTRIDAETAFRDNTAITSVVIAPGVSLAKPTAAYLFSGCTKLTQADISGLHTTGVTSLRAMFSGCTGLKSVNLTGLDTACVTSMAGMFNNCAKLETITGYETWNTGALEDLYMTFNSTSALKTVDLSRWDLSKLKNSGWCFQACKASRILLPDNLKVISAGFFNHVSNYAGTSFAIPAGVEQIGYAHTFYDFGTSAFREFVVAEGNTAFVAIDGILYTADGTKLLAVPRSKTFENGIFELPEGVTFLGELSFSRNQNIKTLVLPDSLEIYNVGLNDENYILYEDVGNLNAGSNLSIAVYCYTGIAQYAVKPTNPRYASANGILYSKDMTAVVAVPSSYHQYMAIPEGVTAWASEAMWAVDTAVVDGLMSKCTGVSIPASLVSIAPDQIAKLNRLNKAYNSFKITVSPQNPIYCMDAKGNLVAHSFTTQTVTPDCTNGGYTLNTCTACGGSYTTATTEPLGHSFTEYVRQENTMTATCDRGCGATDTILLSSNNALRELLVEGYALTPGFRADVTKYELLLPYETEQIKVIATAEDSNATVEIVGGDSLIAGVDNAIQVICTAEDGSRRVYTVVAKRATEPAAPAAADGIIWLVVGVAGLVVVCVVIWCSYKKKKR